MLFYFVRHGQTEANRQHILAGSGMDIPLNEVGHAQARQLALSLTQKLTVPPARVVVSDLQRTQQTAQYLIDQLDLPFVLNPDLREWHLGEWEGRSFEECGHLLLGENSPDRGESRSDFYKRVERGWKMEHAEHEPYLIVSHGGVWMALQDILRIKRFAIGNCDLVEVRRLDQAWHARILGL